MRHKPSRRPLLPLLPANGRFKQLPHQRRLKDITLRWCVTLVAHARLEFAPLRLDFGLVISAFTPAQCNGEQPKYSERIAGQPHATTQKRGPGL